MKRICILGIILLLGSNLCFSQSRTQTSNATAFARLYGYVRFFHPSDEAAGLDWDSFAIYGAKQVEGCKNAKELQAVLTSLFQTFAPTVQIFSGRQGASTSLAHLTPSDTSGLQVVSWQHQGVQLNPVSPLYKSTRTNRLNTYFKVEDKGMGALSKTLDATAYRNKEFIFRARVKMGDGPGTGHLGVRVEKTSQEVGFLDDMKKRPIRSEDWQDYEIKGVVDPDAKEIVFGTFLKASGELWLDNFSFQIKEGGSWKEVYVNAFEKDNPGQIPAGLERSDLDYSYQVLPLTGETRDKWVSIKKQVPPPVGEPSLLFKSYPKVGEFISKDLGSGLTALIPLALYGSREQTFPAADKPRLNRLKGSLALLQDEGFTGDSLYVRLGNLAITWNIFQHFYPYFDIAKTNWSRDLEIAVKEVYADKSEVDFLKTLQRLTAKLKDGHVYVQLPKAENFYSPPITWEWIENQLVLTNILDSAMPLAIGDVVTRINGESPKAYFSKVHQNISAPTKGYLNYRAQSESLMGVKSSTLDLKIKKADHTTSAVTLKRDWFISAVLKALPLQDSIRQLSPGIMYLNIDNTSMKAISEAMPQFQQSRVIICDLRGYPKGNHKFIEHLLIQEDTSSQWMQIPQIIYPDQQRIAGYRKSNWDLKPVKPHLQAKIIFLIDGRAVSYAESFMSYIEHYKLATIVGQPTAGTNGNINPFQLPGGYYLGWTGMKVRKHDGSQLHGVGILPHVYVEKTIKGVRENRDEFLEKALEIAKQAQ